MYRHAPHPVRIFWRQFSVLGLAVLLGLCPAVTRALTPAEYDARIEKLEQEIEALEEEKEQVLKDLREGLFCSRCEKSKREIEKKEPFDQHLDDVNGEPLPASAALIAAKEREYDEKIARLRNQIASLRRQSERDEERKKKEYEEKVAREKREAEQKRLEEKEDREHDRFLRNDYIGSSSSEPRISAAEQKARAQAQFINGLANLVGIFERRLTERREQRRNAAAEAARDTAAAEQREITRRAEVKRLAAEAEKQRAEISQSNWLTGAKDNFRSLVTNLSLKGPLPPDFIPNVASRTATDLAEAGIDQWRAQEPLDLREAAKSGIGGELSGLAYDVALEFLPRETQTQVRTGTALHSWTTLNPITIWNAYDDLTASEIFDQMDQIVVSTTSP